MDAAISNKSSLHANSRFSQQPRNTNDSAMSGRGPTSYYVFPPAVPPNAGSPEPSAPHAIKAFRVQRRLSHPSSSPNRTRTEQEDGEFIKRAFENLAIHTASGSSPCVPSSSTLAREGTTTSTTSTLPGDAAAGAGAADYDNILLRTYPTGSRLSVASTSSHPFSAVSSFSGPSDRTSIYSTRPLLPASHDDSPPSGLSRRRHLRSRSSGHSIAQQGTSPPPLSETIPPGQVDSETATAQAAERRNLQGSSGPTAPLHTFDASYYSSSIWSDPFAEPYDLSRPRMRRRSTISGYSVNTSDWNSLRRGSLASLENGSPTSATYNNILQRTRSRNSTHSNANATSNNNGNASNNMTAASAYATMTRSQQPPQSLRWEAWATAYRESLLQHVHSGFNLFNQAGGPYWLERHPSISEETTGSVLERANLFHHLHRQFVARAGSRSESNRILVLELCHALEEFEAALGCLCKLAHSLSPQTQLSSLKVAATAGVIPESAFLKAADRPPSPRNRPQQQVAFDKTQIELLADEVHSLVREIIESVPAFSYSLSTGNYGPLPFPINNSRTTAPDITIQSYFEQLHLIPAASRVTATDFAQEAMNMEKWWPNRLRTDLREGLLIEAVEDSPQLNMQSISVLPPSLYRQDSFGKNVSSTFHGSHPLQQDDYDRHMQLPAGLTGRNDQLLAEGRRRWKEYVQGRH